MAPYTRAVRLQGQGSDRLGWPGIHPPELLGGYSSYDRQHFKYAKPCKPLGLTWNPWIRQPLGVRAGIPGSRGCSVYTCLRWGRGTAVSPTHIGNPKDSSATGPQVSSQGLICNTGKREMAASSPRMAPCEYLKDPGSTRCHPLYTVSWT